MISDDLINEYYQEGFVRCPKVFSKEEVSEIRRIGYELLKQHRNGPQIQWKNNRPALFFWPQNYSQEIKAFYNSKRMRSIVGQILGKEVRQLNNQIYYREAGDEDQFAWHQDICFRVPKEDFNQIEDAYLQALIVVDPIRENSGAIEFIPRSHLSGDLGLVPRDGSESGLRTFIRGDKKGIKLLAEPGDVLLWSVLVVHGSEKNVSTQNRMTYMRKEPQINATD